MANVEADMCIFITSRLNELVQVYYLQDKFTSPELVTLSDPVALDFESPTAAPITQMHLQLLEYGSKEVPQFRQSNAFARSYHERSIPFHQLTLVLADLSVYQTVILSTEHDPSPEPLVWRRMVVAKHSLDATADVDETNDFVEPNGPDWDADPEPVLSSQALRLISSDRPLPQATADHTAMYEALIHSDQDAGGSTPLEVLSHRLQETMKGAPDYTGSRHM